MAKKTVIRYNSVSELAAALKREPQQQAWKGQGYFERHSEREIKNWCGESIEDAETKFTTGDKKLAAMIKAEGDILTSALGGRQPRIEVSVIGCVPCVPNYLRGVPANMMRVIREPRRNPVISIYVENSIYDGINVKETAKKAAIIANVIAATELAGVRVNLFAVNTADSQQGQFASIVKIKEAQSPLNLLNIAFPLCNRAMHRSIFLRWLERHSDEYIFGYGRPMKGDEVRKAFGLDGVVLSIRDLVDYDRGVEYVTKIINDYLKENGGR